MCVGFAIPAQRPAYHLVEIGADGARSFEAFRAADDRAALTQAIAVAEGVAVEVWRERALVMRVELSGLVRELID